MLAIQFRFIAVATQVIATFAGTGLAATAAAASGEQAAVRGAQDRLDRAHSAFVQQVRVSLADGTPPMDVGPLVGAEARIHNSTPAARTFPVDRMVVSRIEARAKATRGLEGAVAAVEDDVAQDLHQKLATSVMAMQQDVVAARDSGLDTAEAQVQLDEALKVSARLLIPRLAQSTLDEVVTRSIALRQATAERVAANEAATAAAAAAAAALQGARDDASSSRSRAEGALAEARAISVLDVKAEADAIAALAPKFAAAVNIDDFIAVANAYRIPARSLEDILYVRQTSFARVDKARRYLRRAQGVGAPTGNLGEQIEVAAVQLGSAPNIAAMYAASDIIKNITTRLDGIYAEAVAHPPPPPGSSVLGMPFYAQIYSLSCEEAALQMALAYRGIQTNQDAILGAMGEDRRAPELDGQGRLVRWGNPYEVFVGDPNGYREGHSWGSRSGYGTYFSPIARVATQFGAGIFKAGEGIPPGEIYQAALDKRPSVVWVAYEWSPHAVSTYTTWDGRVVMYGAPWEHSVAVAGVSADSVLINNPHGGPQWIRKSTFEASYAMFNNMAVILN